jgi:hypothetical protein
MPPGAARCRAGGYEAEAERLRLRERASGRAESESLQVNWIDKAVRGHWRCSCDLPKKPTSNGSSTVS